jgi:hypothetical protein
LALEMGVTAALYGEEKEEDFALLLMPVSQQTHQNLFFPLQCIGQIGRFVSDLPAKEASHGSGYGTLQHRRMHITLTANRWCIAKTLRNRLDRLNYIFSGLGVQFKSLKFA